MVSVVRQHYAMNWIKLYVTFGHDIHNISSLTSNKLSKNFIGKYEIRDFEHQLKSIIIKCTFIITIEL